MKQTAKRTPTGSLPLTLLLPWAPSANQIWRNLRSGQVYLSSTYQRYLKLAASFYAVQGKPRLVGEAPLRVDLKLFPPSARPFDVDNRIKPTLDALTKLGFWSDDRLVRQVSAAAFPPVQGGAIVAEVTQFDGQSQMEVGRAIQSWFGLKAMPEKEQNKRGKKNVD